MTDYERYLREKFPYAHEVEDPCECAECVPGVERCEHRDYTHPDGLERARCVAVHYTPEQAAAYVRAIMAHPDAEQAKNGGPVPASLL